MSVIIDDIQSKIEVDEKAMDLIKNAIEMSLKQEGFDKPCEVSVLLVGDEQIRVINKQHRNIDRPTDVLSFPMLEFSDNEFAINEGDYDLDKNLLLLGDIVLSLETAKRQAQDYGHSYQRELVFLVTHGVFHLLGYDHMEPEEEKVMMEKQEQILKTMGLARK